MVCTLRCRYKSVNTETRKSMVHVHERFAEDISGKRSYNMSGWNLEKPEWIYGWAGCRWCYCWTTDTSFSHGHQQQGRAFVAYWEGWWGAERSQRLLVGSQTSSRVFYVCYWSAEVLSKDMPRFALFLVLRWVHKSCFDRAFAHGGGDRSSVLGLHYTWLYLACPSGWRTVALLVVPRAYDTRRKRSEGCNDLCVRQVFMV